MTVQQAYSKIAEALSEYKPKFEQMGLNVKSNIFYTDKNLAEMTEFGPKAIIIFGNITVGCESMEDDDYCNYAVCAEIKTAVVDDEELDNGICSFKEELDGFIKKLESSTSLEDTLMAINREQEAEAEKAALEFTKEMKKIRFKLLLGIGVVIAIILAVLLIGPMIK